MVNEQAEKEVRKAVVCCASGAGVSGILTGRFCEPIQNGFSGSCKPIDKLPLVIFPPITFTTPQPVAVQ